MTSLLLIGAGRMGGAMLQSIVRAGVLPADRIAVCEKDPAAASRAAEAGALVVEEPAAAMPCACVIIAVKPQGIAEAFNALQGLPPGTPVCSITAGITIASLQSGLGAEIPVVRVMPNINALSGFSVNAAAFAPGFPAEGKSFVLKILSASGSVIEVGEEKMNAVTGLAGSGPAYVAAFLSGLVEGGVRCGLTPSEAVFMVLQTVEGTVRTLREQAWSTGDLIRTVSSPGGTTVEGLAVLERRGVCQAAAEAVEAACRKADRLGEKK